MGEHELHIGGGTMCPECQYQMDKKPEPPKPKEE